MSEEEHIRDVGGGRKPGDVNFFLSVIQSSHILKDCHNTFRVAISVVETSAVIRFCFMAHFPIKTRLMSLK